MESNEQHKTPQNTVVMKLPAPIKIEEPRVTKKNVHTKGMWPYTTHSYFSEDRDTKK